MREGGHGSSLAFSSKGGGRSSFSAAPASGERCCDTGRGIVDVLACLGSVEGWSKVDADGGRTWKVLVPRTVVSEMGGSSYSESRDRYTGPGETG